MTRAVRTNHHKATWSGQLNWDMDGRSGVTNYAGHASRRGIGLHVLLDREPDRPVAIAIGPSDVPALEGLIEAYRRDAFGVDIGSGRRDAARGRRLRKGRWDRLTGGARPRTDEFLTVTDADGSSRRYEFDYDERYVYVCTAFFGPNGERVWGDAPVRRFRRPSAG